jgi:hypothetical protein
VQSAKESKILQENYIKQTSKVNGLSLSPNGAAQYFTQKRLAKGSTRIPSENIVNAIAEKRRYFNQHKTFMAEPWINLGPENVGGRTRSFIFHPSDPEIIYSVGVSGGIWKSADDGGDNWALMSDYQANNVNNRALLATTHYVFDCGGSGTTEGMVPILQ